MATTNPSRANHDLLIGGLLIFSAVAALVVANSPLAEWYEGFKLLRGGIHLGDVALEKSLLHWVNDAWMAMFFTLIGLEIKREWMGGLLADRRQALLPAIGAIGGMIVPACIYYFFNVNDETRVGWAIPAATDIAFALGVLALVASRVPVSLKIFLLSLAVIDDIGAIAIIAVFYSSQLSEFALLGAASCVAVLFVMNRAGVRRLDAYMVVGGILWFSVLKSGVHATVAGVLMGVLIPHKSPADANHPARSPLQQLERILHPWVMFLCLPMFAFLNAGVSLEAMTLKSLTNPVTLGIIFGLFVGKSVGIAGGAWIFVRLGVVTLPQGANWMHVLGVSFLCGIGFTMSLFIASLAFEPISEITPAIYTLGILGGSTISAIVGVGLLYFASGSPSTTATSDK